MSEVDFWDLTYIEYIRLFDSHAEKQLLDDYRAGVIASVIANCHRGKNTKEFTPSSFFPSLKNKKGKRERQSAEKQKFIARAWTAAFKAFSGKSK